MELNDIKRKLKYQRREKAECVKHYEEMAEHAMKNGDSYLAGILFGMAHDVRTHIDAIDEIEGEEDDLTKEDAEHWMHDLINADGSKGPHWPFEQTTQVMQAKGYDDDPTEFWAVINSLYSDNVELARKYGFDKTDYWAEAAHNWLNDADAKPGKAARYYHSIVD